MLQKHAKMLIICLSLSLIFSFISSSIQFSRAQEAWVEHVTTVVVKPGGRATFNISLRGNDTYILSAENLPEGWTVKFYYEKMEISSISVRENKTVTITMVVSTSPDTSPGEYTIYFVAESPTTLTYIFLSITIEVRSPERQVEVSAQYSYLTKKVGETLTYHLAITNVGEKDETLLLKASPPEGWGYRFLLQGETVSGLYLKAGFQQQLSVEFTPPERVEAGAVSFSITISSDDGEISDEITLYAEILPLTRDVKITSSYQEISVEQGQSFSIPVTISNKGEKDEELILSADLPEGWNGAFKVPETAVKVNSIYLTAGTQKQLLFEAVPTRIPGLGEYTFTLKIGSADGPIGSSYSLRVIIIRVTQPILSCQFPSMTTRPGGSANFQIKLTNPTSLSQAFKILAKELPSGWSVKVRTADKEPASVVNVVGGSSTTLLVEVSVPSDTTSGVYNVILVAESPEISESITLQVDVQAARDVEIAPLYQEVCVEQGQPLSIPVTISNEGECYEELTLNVDLPKGWIGTFRISSDAAVEVGSIYLAAGTSKTLIFEAKPTRIPSPGTYTFMLKVRSADGVISSSYDLKVKVERVSQPILLCRFPLKLTQPGGVSKFQVDLINPTSLDQAFKISVRGLPSGWDAKVKTAEGELVSIVNVRGGSSITLVTEVSVPSDANTGVYDITFTAESPELSESIELYVEVQSPLIKISLNAIPPYLDVYSGSKAKFKMQVSNTGGKDELLNITSLGLPEEFKVKFEDSGGNEITAVYVEAGATKEFFVVVSVPEDIELGARKFTISVFNAEVEEKADLTLNVLGLYRIVIMNTNFYTTLSVGGEGTFTLNVKNTGSMEVTNVRVKSVSVPEGFTIDISPESILSLKVNEEGSFTIIISSDPNINAGNYYIDFNVLSDQTEKLSFTLRVEVFQTTNWLLYAGIGIVIALVFLVLIYRKFGRR